MEVPLEVLRGTIEALELAEAVALRGNRNSLSDAGVAALMAKACAEGAYYNVKINLPGLTDKEYVRKTLTEADDILKQARSKTAEIAAIVEKALNDGLKA